MQNILSQMPRAEYIQRYIDRIHKAKQDQIRAIIICGSTMKGNFGRESDIDLFIIVKEDSQRFIDCLLEYSRFTESYIEPLVYTIANVKQMFVDRHPLLLEVLADGTPLLDTGIWKQLQIEYPDLLRSHQIERLSHGWRITE